MKRIDLLKELQKLTPPKRLARIEAAVQQLRADLEGTPESKSLAVRKQGDGRGRPSLASGLRRRGGINGFHRPGRRGFSCVGGRSGSSISTHHRRRIEKDSPGGHCQ